MYTDALETVVQRCRPWNARIWWPVQAESSEIVLRKR